MGVLIFASMRDDENKMGHLKTLAFCDETWLSKHLEELV
jgi:hypothetical protein